jgi:hypothetical protein
LPKGGMSSPPFVTIFTRSASDFSA